MSADLGPRLPICILYLLFLDSYPSSLLNGTQPKPATCSEVSAIWKCMSEIWRIPSSKNRRPQNPFFDIARVTATLTAYIFGAEHDIHNRVTALETIQESPHRFEISWTLAHTPFIIGMSFYQPFVNSAFYFIARLRRRGSANGTQPNFVKRWTVNRAKNMP